MNLRRQAREIIQTLQTGGFYTECPCCEEPIQLRAQQRCAPKRYAQFALNKRIDMKHHFLKPELKLTAILVGFAICLYGCSSSYTLSSAGKPNSEYSYQEMNQELNGRSVTIVMNGGDELSAEEVTISNDTVSWIDANTSDKSSSVARSIKRIVFKNHLVGGAEGLGIIFPILFIGSWGMNGFSRQGIGGSNGWEFPAILGAIGGGIGMITGAIKGHRYNYEFKWSEPFIEKSSITTDVLFLKDGGMVRGTITKVLVEKSSSGEYVSYQLNLRIRITAEIEEGNRLITVTIRTVEGDVRTYDYLHIKRIEMAD